MNIAPFCQFALPGQTRMQRLAHGQRLHVNLFAHTAADNIIIEGDAPVDDRAAAMPGDIPASTSPAQYLRDVAALIGQLQQRGTAKTVVSAVLTRPQEVPASQLFDAQFAGRVDTFRCMLYHPAIGLWLVATPELLLGYDPDTATYSTMALAGTRPAGTNAPWDDKNRDEQDMVAQFIADTLHPVATDLRRGPTHTRTAGAIEHICTPFAFSSTLPWTQLADRLSPTPAVAGLPRQQALRDIADIERHPRQCYGGYIAVENADGTLMGAYVTLRCCQIAGGHVCIYAGGGVTPQSDAQAEWDEILLKISNIQGHKATTTLFETNQHTHNETYER